ncbi:hypothetical protein FQN53_006502 [Emmonsiellopsis sp. PD_33]|nr:hypothetical protein FQN53_006502 [Emmonsiellopsis sp. PD_33]
MAENQPSISFLITPDDGPTQNSSNDTVLSDWQPTQSSDLTYLTPETPVSARPTAPLSPVTASQLIPDSQQVSDSQTATRVSWDPRMEEALLNGFITAQREGHASDNGNFKPRGWAIAVDAVKAITTQDVKKPRCVARWKKIKRIWSLWLKHQSQISGWTWDPVLETYVTEPEIMDEYFRTHPEMQIFRHRGPPHRILLEQILTGQMATGSYAVSHTTLVQRQRNRPTEQDNYGGDDGDDGDDGDGGDGGEGGDGGDREGNRNSPLPPRTALGKRNAAGGDSRSIVRKRSRGGGLADSVGDLGERLVESAEVQAHTLRATDLFLAEVQEVLPEEWKEDDGGERRIPFDRYVDMLDIFNSARNCQVYISMHKRSRLDERRTWLLKKMNSME